MTELSGILAIDPARNIGFAFARPGEEPTFGSRTMGREGGTFGELFYPFEVWLDKAILYWLPRYVCYLQPRLLQWDNTIKIQRNWGLTACLNAVVERHRCTDMPEISCHYTDDATMARFFTGKARWGGREFKKAACIATCNRFGWDVGKDDDAADALGLLVYVENQLYQASAIARGSAGPLFQPRAQRHDDRPTSSERRHL